MKNLTGWDKDTSPHHAGERELHERLGRADQQDRMGRKVIRPFMPEQHRTFFGQLPFMIGGGVDTAGWPWASILFGQPGFVESPNDRTLSIAAAALPGDPFAGAATTGAPVSFVGIELPTRRRNRVNGVVRARNGDALVVDVVQSFGNCPQYIHTREMDFVSDPAKPSVPLIETFQNLDGEAARIIANADTFFVASHNPHDDKFDNGGVDVNHRGGNPGFVKIEGNTLTIPDFIGNFAFNTLGNFVVNPKAGLLFIDFETGDLVQMTGTVELLWEPTEEIEAFQGAERAWRFHLDHGHRLIAASPLRWRSGAASPNSQLTGDWTTAAQTQDAEKARKTWRPFRITRVKDESTTIRSFHLEPTDGKATLPSKPGQYLTIRVTPHDGREDVRTYTLSSAPSDGHYRISVKREDETQGVSRHLHDTLGVGDIIDARAPNGDFWLDTDERRPAVLIAGGVGITPMIAMARQVAVDGFTRRHMRPLTVIHAARTTAQRAFADEFASLQKAGEGALRYVSIVSVPTAAEVAGEHFHADGHITAELLQSVLPIADYDFYLCGPPTFMQAVYDMLIGLGVQDARVFAEAFGPAALQRTGGKPPENFEAVTEAIVTFEASGVEQAWTSGDGTLLELAQAHGLTPSSGCQRGACGSCAARLISGSIGYTTHPTFAPDDGEVLICCAVPAQSDEPLKIDV